MMVQCECLEEKEANWDIVLTIPQEQSNRPTARDGLLKRHRPSHLFLHIDRQELNSFQVHAACYRLHGPNVPILPLSRFGNGYFLPAHCAIRSTTRDTF